MYVYKSSSIKARHHENSNIFHYQYIFNSIFSGSDEVLCQSRVGNDLNTGMSWDQAFENLQTALNINSINDTIWVAQGIYYPDKGTGTVNDDRSSSFFLDIGVNIYGGFSGSETILNERDWLVNFTILSGDLMQNDGSDFKNYEDNAYHVVRCANQTQVSTLDGFIIEAGNADTVNENIGAGMYNINADPMIKNCTFQNNYSGSNGGGMQNASASPTILNCYFLKNESSQGAGMFNNNASPNLIDCTFEKNNSGYGGGIYNINNSKAEITRCEFKDNHAKGDTTIVTGGGAIYNDSSNVIITNCTFLGNSADKGGGVENNKSTPDIINSIFLGNLSDGFGGGAIYNGSSNTGIINCSFSGNKANFSGGALYNINSNPVMTNTVIWNNQDQSGTGTSDASMLNSSSTPNITYSLVQNITTTTNNNIDGIMLAGDSNYPGFIQEANPSLAPSTLGNLRTYLGSPLIDTGNNLVVSTLLDPDGYQRINGIVDIGAYENPATNCPNELILTIVYSPLKGTYEAVQKIELKDGAWISSSGSELILNALEVLFSPITESELGAAITVQSNGCIP